MSEGGIFGLRIEPKTGVAEESVMRVMARLFEEQPTQGFNEMVDALSGATGALPMDRIDGAAIVFSAPFAGMMEQRGYRKHYEEEVLDNGETRQNCVGFERIEE